MLIITRVKCISRCEHLRPSVINWLINGDDIDGKAVVTSAGCVGRRIAGVVEACIH